MVTDFLSWLIKYRDQGLEGLSDCFGYSGLHHFFHFINFLVFKLVGMSFSGWYIVLAIMHGVNASLVYFLTRKWNDMYLDKPSRLIPLFASITFLLFPFNMEAVVWKACLHYLIITAMFLGGIISLLAYLDTKSESRFYLVHIFYVLALFTLELSFAYAFVMGVLILFHTKERPEPAYQIKLFKSILLPQLALLALYFVLTKFLIGDFIGHYGAEKHLNFDAFMIMGNAWSYLCKIFLFAHAWSFAWREYLYTVLLSNHALLLILTLSSLATLSYVLKRWSRIPIQIKSALVYLIVGLLCLAPVINLFFMWVTPYENDRYSYLGGLFLIIALVYFFSAFRQIKYLFMTTYLLASVIIFSSMMRHAAEAGKLLHSLLDSFDFENHQGTIYILAIPDNYNGMYMYRDYTGDAIAFRESLELFREVHPKAQFVNIAQYNQRKPQDSIKFDRIESNVFNVGFRQYGNWFWRNGIGFTDYENESYEARLKQGYYQLTIESLDSKGLFIYPEAGNWKSEAVYTD